MAEPSHHHRCAGIRLGTNSPDPGSALRPCSKTRLCTDKLVIFTMMLLLSSICTLLTVSRMPVKLSLKSYSCFWPYSFTVTPELMYVQSLSLHVCFSHLSAEGGTFFCAYLKGRKKEVRAFQKHWNLDLIISTQQCLTANCWWTKLH